MPFVNDEVKILIKYISGKNHLRVKQILYLLCFLGLFLILLIESYMTITGLIVLVPPLVYVLMIRLGRLSEELHKYQTRMCKAFLFLINLYFTFALVGNGLFFLENSMNLSVRSGMLFVLFFIVLYPCGTALLHGFEKIRSYANAWNEVEDTHQVRRIGFLCAVIIFSTLFIISWGFYPVVMTTDGVSHWIEALGLRQIGDSHPAAYVLLIRLTAQIIPNPYTYVIIQLMMFSTVMGAFLAFFYQKGVPKLAVIVIAFTLALMPNNFMTLMLMSKNPFHAIFLLWLMYLLIRLFDKPGKFSTSKGYFMCCLMLTQLSINLVGVGLIRHNGFLALAAVGLIVCWMTIRYYKKMKVALLISFVFALILMQMVRGPVYDAFNVNRGGGDFAIQASMMPLITPLAAAISNDVDLPGEILDVMERILPLDEWGLRYIRYSQYRMYYVHPRPDLDQTNFDEIIRIYLKMLLMHPDVVLLDRLDGIESLWNVFPSRGEGAHNSRFRIGVPPILPEELMPPHLRGTEPVDWAHFQPNFFTTIPMALVRVTSSVALADIFIWRTGIFIVLFFYLLLFSFARGEKIYTLVALPSFATLITLILVVMWQLYQYFWFFPISIIIFFIYVLLVPKTEFTVS